MSAYANVHLITSALFKWAEDSDPVLFSTENAHLNSWITFMGNENAAENAMIILKQVKQSVQIEYILIIFYKH